MVSNRAGFVLGGDIGGTNVRVAAADLFGELICDLKAPTTKRGSRALGVQVLEMITEVIDRAGASHGRPLALGISAPGVVAPQQRRVTSLAYNVTPEGGFDPLEVIRGRLDIPVFVDNNVNLAAVGEKWFGLARGVSTLVYIAVGAGIGMGVIIDDELVRGAHGAAGEIAYLPLVGDPFDPGHRLHGGLEDEVAAAGVLDAFNRRRGGDQRKASSAHEVLRSPQAVTRRLRRWSITSPRGSARRSRPSARSSIRSSSCSAAGSAPTRCCCGRSAALRLRSSRSRHGSRRARSAIGPRCTARSPSACRPSALNSCHRTGPAIHARMERVCEWL